MPFHRSVGPSRRQAGWCAQLRLRDGMSCLAGLRGPTLAILTPIPSPARFLSGDSVQEAVPGGLGANKKTPPGGFPPGGAHWPKSGNRSPLDLLTVNSLAGNRPDRLHRRRRGVGGRLSGTRGTARIRTACRLAAAVAGRAVGLSAAAAGAAAALASVLGLQCRDHVTQAVTMLPSPAARSRTAAGLAAASTGVAGRLSTAVAGSAGGLSATIASVASRFAATVAGIAAGFGAAAVLTLALREQTLQTTKQIVLLPSTAARTSPTARLAAASTGVAGRLSTAVAGSAGGLSATIASTTAGLAAASTGIAAGLTARSTALAAEHPVKELETEGLATNGNAEDQRTKIHHTLHRATSPLLVNHRCGRPACDGITPRL